MDRELRSNGSTKSLSRSEELPFSFPGVRNASSSTASRMLSSVASWPAKGWDEEGSHDLWKHEEGRRGGRRVEDLSFKNRPGGGDDPPTRLIGNFLREQIASGVELSLDLDLVTDEVGRPSLLNSREREARATDQSSSSDNSDSDDGEVTPAGSGGRPLLRAMSKTRSRLMDPPPRSPRAVDEERKSSALRPPKSGPNPSGRMTRKSGAVGMSGLMEEEEEDDPFVDDDMPDDSKRGKIDTLTILQWVLASSFHVSSYFDRIQEALFNQYVIETLSGPELVGEDYVLAEVRELQRAGATIPEELRAGLPPKTLSGQRTNRVSGLISRGNGMKQLSEEKKQREMDEGITIDKLHRLNQRNVSAWNMKRLMKIVRFGTLTTMDEKIQKPNGEMGESAIPIHTEFEAQVAAKKIFNNVAKPGSKHIYLADLMRFMKQEEAIKTMHLFEGAQEHCRVSKRSLKNWLVNAFRERKALALTLNDTKTAVNKLNVMGNVVVGLIVSALWLLILGIATTHFFVFMGSQLLVAVFVFGNTMKTIFEAIIFLFVMHPFDVGDRCEIEEVQVVVEEMNIMTTVFLRYDNLKIYYPNSILATKPIFNFHRSPDMGEGIDFSIHVATVVEKLSLMKERILRYIDSKKEHWYPGAMVVLRDVDETNKLKVSIWLRHTLNFQDMGMRFVRRELVLQEMIRVLKDLDIEYRMLPLDVNVRNTPPLQSTRMPTTWSYS
ncbi:hypothetical protein QYE76_071808 [Lolium multiflorum]|uniref:Mechanosensitive ion channel protein n=1 Tax=Lolium multiflorum TaxID=4521 RepID=A0AAD8WF77_LOLMU|nr:hypothetical protein QYE76_071808 [Lolium multiflorum]